MDLLKRLFVEEEGQGLVEYALIIALIAIGAIAAMGLLSGSINGIFGDVQVELDNATP